MPTFRSVAVGFVVAVVVTLTTDLVPVSFRLEMGTGPAAERLTGFYGVDRRDGSLGRWTNGDGTIRLPPRGRWPADVVVALSGHPARAGEVIDVVAADGPVVALESTGAPQAARLVVDEGDSTAPLVVRLTSAASTSADDPRALGVFVYDAWLTTGGRRAVSWRWPLSAGMWASVVCLWAVFVAGRHLFPAAGLTAGAVSALVVAAVLIRLRFETWPHLWWLALVAVAIAAAILLARSGQAVAWVAAGPEGTSASGAAARRASPAARAATSPLTAVLLAAIPIVLLGRLLVRHHVDVLFWDQWGMLEFVSKWLDGQLAPHDLWRQANEHRPLFPRLVLIPLAWLTGWNTRVEVAINVALMGGLLALFASALATAGRRAHVANPWLVLPIVSLLVFSPNQWENWLWGWQFLVFLQVGAVVAGFWCLTGEQPSRLRFAVALMLGVVASYSFGGGLVYWGIGPLALLFGQRRGCVARLVAWILVGGLTAASYFVGYHSIAGHPPWSANFVDWYGLRNFLGFVPTYIGAPLVSTDRQVARAAGAVGLALFVLLGGLALVGRRTREAAWFPVMMGAWVVGCAVLTALGRAPTGQEQALASRYITMSMPFWVALVMLLQLAPAAATVSTLQHRAALTMVSWAAVVGLGLFALLDWPRGAAAFVRWEGRLAPARQALIDGRNDPVLGHIFPSVPHVVEWREDLRRHRLSVFRDKPPPQPR